MKFIFPFIPITVNQQFARVMRQDQTGDGGMHGDGDGDSLEWVAEEQMNGIGTPADDRRHDRYTPTGEKL